MLARNRLDGSVVSACATHDTTQMLQRPSLVSSRPALVKWKTTGSVKTQARTNAPSTTAVASADPRERMEDAQNSMRRHGAVLLGARIRRRCRHGETAAECEVQVDALDALLGLDPNECREGRRQRQLPLLDEPEISAANLELRLHHRQCLLVVVDRLRQNRFPVAGRNFGGERRLDFAERAQADDRIFRD